MTDFEPAFMSLERDTAKKRTPSRYDLRVVLIAIGEQILEGREVEAQAALTRLSRMRSVREEDFDVVVGDEMALACSEHIRGCDRRHLDRPDYDFAYTVEARHRLEARLRALERLEIEVDDSLLEQVAQADLTLAPYLERDTNDRR